MLKVRINANYVEICKVGSLEADFQQVPLVQFFWNFYNIFLWNSYYSNSAKKGKTIFLDENSKKITLL